MIGCDLNEAAQTGTGRLSTGVRYLDKEILILGWWNTQSAVNSMYNQYITISRCLLKVSYYIVKQLRNIEASKP